MKKKLSGNFSLNSSRVRALDDFCLDFFKGVFGANHL